MLARAKYILDVTWKNRLLNEDEIFYFIANITNY